MKELLSLLRAGNFSALFKGKTNNSFILFLRYVPVGGAATVVDWFFLWFLYSALSFNLYLSAALSFTAGLLTNYFLAIFFVFQKHTEKMSRMAEFIGYAITGIIGLGLTELLLYISTDILKIHYMPAKIVITAIVLIWNFASKKIFIYGKEIEK